MSIVAERPSHGYRVITRLRELGLGSHKGGTIYPLLSRLEDKNRVTSAWDTSSAGAARKMYTVTDDGRDALIDARRAWRQVNACLSAIDGG
ncbi:PadR family transcriptional regulator [Micrococcus sp.]|uniref:PadR family transcriptional regulator n=1 Tax=Micrococcus sp. TaxID=1271 RepID=UPI002A91DB31|nr:PadR family transcriptional regulator [Micrococcus sp.]MDY6055306.1 PadR family transcriptional regulator [Micrococcus sp.]